MNPLKCPQCGAALEVPAGASIAECPYCGTGQTLPERAAKPATPEDIAAAMQQAKQVMEAMKDTFMPGHRFVFRIILGIAVLIFVIALAVILAIIGVF